MKFPKILLPLLMLILTVQLAAPTSATNTDTLAVEMKELSDMLEEFEIDEVLKDDDDENDGDHKENDDGEDEDDVGNDDDHNEEEVEDIESTDEENSRTRTRT